MRPRFRADMELVVFISKMQKLLLVELLIFASYCLVITSAVSSCGFRPTVQNDHDTDSSTKLPERCILEAPRNHEHSQEERKPRVDFISWDYNHVEREWNLYCGQCAFTEFNQKIGSEYYEDGYVQEFIKQASIEERKNNGQVIAYHGERIGMWLLQVLAKQLKYPHAKEWLPLRFISDSADIDAIELQKIINYGHTDHSPEFRAIGLAAHVNLMSKNPFESATCAFFWEWVVFSELSHQFIIKTLTSLGIPTMLHALVQERLTAMSWAIQWKMKWKGGETGIVNFESNFPSVNLEDIETMKAWQESYVKESRREGVGMILQIVMPPELAQKYSYASGPWGRIKNEPYLEYYRNHKTKLDDDGQLRIATGHPFTRYPSPVKIKALSPIFHDSELMDLLAKMMKDTVDLINQKRK